MWDVLVSPARIYRRPTSSAGFPLVLCIDHGGLSIRVRGGGGGERSSLSGYPQELTLPLQSKESNRREKIAIGKERGEVLEKGSVQLYISF